MSSDRIADETTGLPVGGFRTVIFAHGDSRAGRGVPRRSACSAWARRSCWCLRWGVAALLLGIALAWVPWRPLFAAPETGGASERTDTTGVLDPVDPGAVSPIPVPVPEPTAEAIRYHREGRWIWLAARLWGLAVPACVLVFGVSARFRDAAWNVAARWVPLGGLKVSKWSRKARALLRWLVATAGFGVLILVLLSVLNLPLSVYAGYLRPHVYGLSNQSVGRWLGLWAIDLGVGLAMTVPVIWGVYGLLCWSPRRWWLWAGLLAVPVGFLMAMVKPVLVDPLYNEFGPMRDQVLEARILALADRAGVGGAEVFVVDKSRDTKAVNAYVTGFLGTKRIVLWDTLLETLDDDEVLAVVGHELGHYVRGDVARGLLMASTLVLIGLYLIHRAARWTLARCGERLGIGRLADVASLPLLLLLSRVVALVLVPIGYAYSRNMEFESDRFALELTRDNRAAASAFVALQRENLGHPRPPRLDTLLRSTHPSLGDRIDFCNTYHPWTVGGPLRPSLPSAVGRRRGGDRPGAVAAARRGCGGFVEGREDGT